MFKRSFTIVSNSFVNVKAKALLVIVKTSRTIVSSSTHHLLWADVGGGDLWCEVRRPGWCPLSSPAPLLGTTTAIYRGSTGVGVTIGGHLYLKELFHLELLFKSKNNALGAVFYQTIPVFPALKTAPWLLSSPN